MTDLMILLICLLVILIACVVSYKYKPKQDPLIKKIKMDVSKLDPRIEHIDFFSSDESYTEDKNKIFLCLKDENDNYYDYNMLIYVAIHECSHALTEVVDVKHVTPEFRKTFETLLNKANKLGIYSPSKPLTTKYCKLNLKPETMQR